MLQAIFIKENKEKIIEGLKKRYISNIEIIFFLLKKVFFLLDDKYKIQLKLDTIYLIKKKLSNFNCDFFNIKKSYSLKTITLFYINKELLYNLLKIPNIPHVYVNKGHDLINNEIIFEFVKFEYIKRISHWNLFKKFELINYKLGPKISGTGFSITKGKIAKLHRAMIEYFIEYNLQKGYIEYTVPYLVKPLSAKYTGQLPDKEGQMYHLPKDNLYLISTGEISLINCYNNVLFKENKLPIKMTTYTTCFRREAGSYGSNIKGLNRLHQFDKVEIIQITNSKNSFFTLQLMIQHVKKLLISLNLPFRLLRLCGGDIGFTSAITYDFEVFSFSQNKWIEVSSISDCTFYQANRLKLRYKKNNKEKIHMCHTLNGSSISIQRILLVLLENHQKNNLIEIPETLIPYTGFNKIYFS